MSLRLAPTPDSPGERLERLLLAGHADGRDATGAACEPPWAVTPARARAAGLVPQDDGHWCDPSWDRHGLSWWYPHLVEMVKVRSTKGRTGAGGAVAVPIDLSALDFLAGKYWALDEPPTEKTEDDPASYRDGFIPTIIALEQSARIALRLGPRPRLRAQGYDGLPGSYDGRVDGALGWLATQAQQLIDDAPQLATTIRDEASRLIGKAKSLVLGNRFEATINTCQYCEQETVIADEDRAFCRNPDCRTPDGARYCWQLLEVTDVMTDETTLRWIEVDEPDVRGRGHLSEEQLSRWSAVI